MTVLDIIKNLLGMTNCNPKCVAEYLRKTADEIDPPKVAVPDYMLSVTELKSNMKMFTGINATNTANDLCIALNLVEYTFNGEVYVKRKAVKTRANAILKSVKSYDGERVRFEEFGGVVFVDNLSQKAKIVVQQALMNKFLIS